MAPGEVAQHPRQVTNPAHRRCTLWSWPARRPIRQRWAWQLSASVDAIESLPQPPAVTPCALVRLPCLRVAISRPTVVGVITDVSRVRGGRQQPHWHVDTVSGRRP
jgi:hypothetical protein